MCYKLIAVKYIELIGLQALSFKRPYCHLAWNCVCLCVCVFVCADLGGRISRKQMQLGGKLLWGAYRKVVGAFEW